MSDFEIKTKDGLARIGKFRTRHGTVTTPLLMPVIHPGRSEIAPAELVSEFGFQMVITNSYIISRREELRETALKRGVHGLLDFEGPVMTDSGTFQMYFHDLPSEEIDPLEIVRFQRDIGSDVGTILDVFSAPDVGRQQVEHDVLTSLKRGEMSVPEKGDMLLAGTVQGGVYTDLREMSARRLAQLDFDVHPIGGVVPLMEQYRYSDVVRVTLAAKRHLPPDRPVHLFGCGHPMFLALATALGCDLFDSASYAKFADDDRLMLTSGTVHLKDLRELPCDCPVCSSTTVEELKRTNKSERRSAIMRHNLYVTSAEMRRIRQAIAEGELLQLASARARSHPSLYDALQTLLHRADQIERSHPVGTTTSVFYTGPETAHLPVYYRLHDRIMTSYPYRRTETVIVVPHLADTPFAETTPTVVDLVKRTTPERLIVVYLTPFGAVPWEFEHVHPVQQSVFPRYLDADTLNTVRERALEVLTTIEADEVVWFARSAPTQVLFEAVSEVLTMTPLETAAEVTEHVTKTASGVRHRAWTLRKLRALFTYQWGISDTGRLEQWNVELSRATGKIRYIREGEDILFTMMPMTGLLIPTYEGGLALEDMGLPERYYVAVNDEAAPFVAEGRSALAKFVKNASPELRAGEEVLVTDEGGTILAVGRALLTGEEMLTLDRGVAVTIRHSQPSQ